MGVNLGDARAAPNLGDADFARLGRSVERGAPNGVDADKLRNCVKSRHDQGSPERRQRTCWRYWGIELAAFFLACTSKALNPFLKRGWFWEIREMLPVIVVTEFGFCPDDA